MHEAIITVNETETVDGVTYPTTKVFRVEFEGNFGIVGEADNTDTFELTRVVNCEQLVADETAVTPGEVKVFRNNG
jgi:hypothetical protein